MTSCCERMATRLRSAYHELDKENADLKASEERLAAENLRLKAALHEIINTALVVMPTTAPLAPTAPTTPLAPTAPTMAPSTAPTSA